MTDRVPEHWECARCHEPLATCLCPLGPLRPLRDYAFGERTMRRRNAVIVVVVCALIGALYFTLAVVERGLQRSMEIALRPPPLPPAPLWRALQRPRAYTYTYPITSNSIQTGALDR